MCKSSVSALQEFCSQQKLPLPEYDYIDSVDGGFACKVCVMDVEAHGNGRSKRDAKHNAAANVIKRLRLTYPNIDGEIPATVIGDCECPSTDMIIKLRDYCVQHHHPLPTIEILQQGGTPDAPEFTALCTVASIRRYGVSENKKDARQKAAYEMLRVIVDEDGLEQDMQVATLDSKAEDIETERYHKFKTYRELTESKTGEMPGILLCDRHSYFNNFYDELKKAAGKVLATTYETDRDQAMDLFESLKIQPKITKMTAVDKMERLVMVEMNCDYDVVLAEIESKIYKSVVEYFRVMLQ